MQITRHADLISLQLDLFYRAEYYHLQLHAEWFSGECLVVIAQKCRKLDAWDYKLSRHIVWRKITFLYSYGPVKLTGGSSSLFPLLPKPSAGKSCKPGQVHVASATQRCSLGCQIAFSLPPHKRRSRVWQRKTTDGVIQVLTTYVLCAPTQPY